MRDSTFSCRMCLLSSSTFSQEGGIQRVTQMTLRALQNARPELPIELLSLHDKTDQEIPDQFRSSDPALLTYRPCNSSRVGYSLATLRAILRGRPSLVISDHAHLNVLPALSRSLREFQFISFVHYAELHTLGPVRLGALRMANLIVAVSEFTAQLTRRLVGPRPRIEVCHLGLSPEYPYADRAGVEPPAVFRDRKSILIVGRMADQLRDKGHETLIRAMPEVARCVPNALLVVVGRGADQTRLERLVDSLGMRRYVHFAGFVRDAELPAYYRGCTVFAMPSHSEGFGLVYLEAMYHAKPCLAGNEDAAREVVEDGVTGILVKPGSVPEVAAGLTKLLTDDRLASQMGNAGLDRLRRLFTYDRFADRFLQLAAPYLDQRSRPS